MQSLEQRANLFTNTVYTNSTSAETVRTNNIKKVRLRSTLYQSVHPQMRTRTTRSTKDCIQKSKQQVHLLKCTEYRHAVDVCLMQWQTENNSICVGNLTHPLKHFNREHQKPSVLKYTVPRQSPVLILRTQWRTLHEMSIFFALNESSTAF